MPVGHETKHLVSAQGMLLALWEPSDAFGVYAIPVDYLLVRGKQKPDLNHALSHYQIGTLLIDGSVPDYRTREWMQQAEACHVPCRNLHDGAVYLNLKH